MTCTIARITVATLETPNFTFDACGDSADAARVALEKGLKHHAKQRGLPEYWFQGLDINIREMTLGAAYRDRELLK